MSAERLRRLSDRAVDSEVAESLLSAAERLQGWRDVPKPLASLAGQLGLFGADEIGERARAEAERRALTKRQRLDQANGQGQLF